MTGTVTRYWMTDGTSPGWGSDAIREKARSWAHTELADMMWRVGGSGEPVRERVEHACLGCADALRPDETRRLTGLPQWIQDRKCPAEWFRPNMTFTWMKGSR